MMPSGGGSNYQLSSLFISPLFPGHPADKISSLLTISQGNMASPDDGV